MDHAMCINRELLSYGEWNPSAPFKAKRGVRQGDPLSPYLFVLLTRSLKKLRMQESFKFHPRCQNLYIVQLSFADDLLLFSRGDLQSVKLMYECFLEFSRVSSLVTNQSKSNIYFGGVQEHIEQQIFQLTGFKKGSLPFKYLGVPLSSKD